MLKNSTGSFDIEIVDGNYVLKIKNGTVYAQFTLDMSRKDIPIIVKSQVSLFQRVLAKWTKDEKATEGTGKV
jgi:hypothetical protein